MRSIPLVVAAACLALPGAAFAQPKPESFVMPSGNVACVYTARGGSTVYSSADGTAELSCDREKPSFARVTMTERSRVEVVTKAGDQGGCCGGDVTLAYGKTWSKGPFSCESKESGLTCRRSDGRGFTINRAGLTRF